VTPSDPPSKRHKAKRLAQGVARDVAALRGQGLSQRTTARALGISQQRVSQIQSVPELRAEIERQRLV
jgi:DNA-binding CsgD family transcriptional regulator